MTREPSDQQRSFVQCARSEQLSAVSSPMTMAVSSETGSTEAHVSRRSCETQLSISVSTTSKFSSSKCLSEDKLPVPPRVEEAPRTSKNSPWCLELLSVPSLTFPRSCVGVVGSKANAHALTAIQLRLSPMNLSRPTSFATADAPEANLGSSEEGGNMQASLQRSVLRTQARHCCWVTAKNEESSPSASMFSRLRKSCATHAGSQSSNGTIGARARKTDASGDDLFCGYLWGISSVGPALWVAWKNGQVPDL